MCYASTFWRIYITFCYFVLFQYLRVILEDIFCNNSFLFAGDYTAFADSKAGNNGEMMGVEQAPQTPAPSQPIHDPDSYVPPPLLPPPTAIPPQRSSSHSSSSSNKHHSGASQAHQSGSSIKSYNGRHHQNGPSSHHTKPKPSLDEINKNIQLTHIAPYQTPIHPPSEEGGPDPVMLPPPPLVNGTNFLPPFSAASSHHSSHRSSSSSSSLNSSFSSVSTSASSGDSARYSNKKSAKKKEATAALFGEGKKLFHFWPSVRPKVQEIFSYKNFSSKFLTKV